jgi:hypothetical protein
MNSLLESIKNTNQIKSSNIDNKGTSNKIPINQQKGNNSNQKTNFLREFQSAIEKGLGKSSESTDNKLKNKLTEIKTNNTLNEDENIFSGSSSSSSDDEDEDDDEEEEEDQLKEFNILNNNLNGKKKKNDENMFSSSDDDDDDDDSSNSDNSDDSSNSDNESNKKRKKHVDNDDNDMNNLYNLKFGANKHNKIINDNSKNNNNNNNRINSNKKTKTVKSVYESYQEKESIKLKSTGQDIRLVTIGNVNYVILKDIYSNCGLFGAATKSYKSSKKYIKVDGRRACVLDISNTAALLDKTRKTFSNSNLNEGESETRKKVKIFKDARIELLKILHERFHEELKDIIESPQENNQSKRASKKQKINNNNNNNNATTKSEIEINDDNNLLKKNKIENNNIIEHIIYSNDDNSNFILSTLVNILTKFWKSNNVPQYTKNEIFVEFTNKIFTILTPTNNDNNNDNNNTKSII